MIKSWTSAAATIGTAVCAGALLVGCSASVSTTPKMSKEKVGDTIAQKLASTTGAPKPDVSCPEDLEGKAGTSMRCTVTATDGSTVAVDVKVKSVDGDQINFDYEVDQKVNPAPSN
ncbi:DUF4333 domain-containing protein [Streptomyces sp. cg35]|uniref:DUF4333 domain-containing protein n=1 Tax=Streptomyces sp. cg35 TaxID=3421650 RepID=UPI003D17B443